MSRSCRNDRLLVMSRRFDLFVAGRSRLDNGLYTALDDCFIIMVLLVDDIVYSWDGDADLIRDRVAIHVVCDIRHVTVQFTKFSSAV